MPEKSSPLAEQRTQVAFAVLESFAALESAMREADHSLRHAAGSDPVAVADKLLSVATANDAHTQALAHYRATVRVFDLVEGILKLQRHESEPAEPTAAAPVVVPFQTT